MKENISRKSRYVLSIMIALAAIILPMVAARGQLAQTKRAGDSPMQTGEKAAGRNGRNGNGREGIAEIAGNYPHNQPAEMKSSSPLKAAASVLQNVETGGISISPESQEFSWSPSTSFAVGNNGIWWHYESIEVTAAEDCQWTATVSEGTDWIQIVSGVPWTGNGTVTYEVADNYGSRRTGTISIQSINTATPETRNFTVIQNCRRGGYISGEGFPAEGGLKYMGFSLSLCNWELKKTAGWFSLYDNSSTPGSGDRQEGGWLPKSNSIEVSAESCNNNCPRGGVITGLSEPTYVLQGGSCGITMSIPPQPNVVLSGNYCVDGNMNEITIHVEAGSNCQWSLYVTAGTGECADWIVFPTAGDNYLQAGNYSEVRTGSGDYVIRVKENTGTERYAGIRITNGLTSSGGVALYIKQYSKCRYQINKRSIEFGTAGGTSEFAVSSMSQCGYTAVVPASTPQWLHVLDNNHITINPDHSPSTVTVLAQPRGSSDPARSSWVEVHGNQNSPSEGIAGYVLVNQGCEFTVTTPTIENFQAAGGNGTVSVSSAGGCNWAAFSEFPWITITSGPTYNGSGTVSYTVAPNTGMTRTGTITVADKTITITQAGPCPYSIAPASQNFASATGTGTFSITADTGCSWTAISNDSWITITSGASGSGNGTVAFTVSQNTGTAVRTGTITIGGKVFTVRQGFPFVDAATHPFASYIEKLAAAGVTAGCDGAGNFCPDATVTREQMAIFIERILLNGANPPAPPATPTFSDVTPDMWSYPYVEDFYRRGISSGCGGGLFCRTSVVTREQMAIFIEKALLNGANPPAPPATPTFSDVPSTRFSYPYVEDFYRRGISTGCGQGIFCPDTPVTRAQMAVFLVKAFNL